MRPILTITGSDSTSASGIQADIKTISQLGGYAVTAITSITVQTTLGIQEFHDLPADIVRGQIEAVMNDVQPDVVKVGMIRSRDVIDVLVDILQRYRPRHVIYAPVVLSAQGEPLLDEQLALDIRQRLIPLCTLVVQKDIHSQHGMANRYASAVATFLSRGDTPAEAQRKAQQFVDSEALRDVRLQGRGSELYAEFLDAVTQHCRTNSDVQFYANLLNVSSRYLAQVTRRMVDKTPKMLIDGRLLQEVATLLLSTDLTVQEIAYACGFSSQAHLTKFFKKNKGVSPTVFRKNTANPTNINL